MIVMLDTSDDLAVCAKELGAPVEQLLTPLTRYLLHSEKFAIDNGCFSPNFDVDGFLRLLEKHKAQSGNCRFVAVPDVVGCARRTLEVFRHWEGRLIGWRKALVAQDGLEDLEIPWWQIDAIFVGGSTEWKMSKCAADVIKAARLLQKWVHVGRVNTPGRFEYFESLGADSTDGTGLSKYTWMRERIYRQMHEPGLFTEVVV